MHKIAYTLVWSTRWGSGIIKKVMTQTKYWIEAGYDVHMFMISYEDEATELVHRLNPRLKLTMRRCRNVPDRFVQYQHLLPLVMAWNPDIIYHRYAGYYPALAYLARRYPMVVEINTDDVGEYALGPRYRSVYNSLTRGRLLSRVRGMVYINGELPTRPHFACFGKPAKVIANGIDLSLCHTLPPPDNAVPHVVYIGSPHQPWHGVDKILVLAELCPDWQFDIIGSQADELERPPPPNMRIHGFLERKDYEPLFAQADVALGSLALHRNNMNEGSPLKNSEYLAYGLPLIIAHTDANFPDPPPFILQVPNTPDTIQTSLPAIRDFVSQIKGTRVPRAEVAHIDAREKERQRLTFFAQLAE